MRTDSRANNDYMIFVEVMLGEVQMEQQFLAGEEPSGVGGRVYLDIRWQRKGTRCFLCQPDDVHRAECLNAAISSTRL
jgi:hypothetical protein